MIKLSEITNVAINLIRLYLLEFRTVDGEEDLLVSVVPCLVFI